jgi:hypothetical protein
LELCAFILNTSSRVRPLALTFILPSTPLNPWRPWDEPDERRPPPPDKPSPPDQTRRDEPASPPRRGRQEAAPRSADSGLGTAASPSPGRSSAAIAAPAWPRLRRIQDSGTAVVPAPPSARPARSTPTGRAAGRTVFLPLPIGQVFARPPAAPRPPQLGERRFRHRRRRFWFQPLTPRPPRQRLRGDHCGEPPWKSCLRPWLYYTLPPSGVG